MGNQDKQSCKKKQFSLNFHSDFTFGDKTHPVNGETPFLGLPADQEEIVEGVGIFYG